MPKTIRQSTAYRPFESEIANFRAHPRDQVQAWHRRFGTTTLGTERTPDRYCVEIIIGRKDMASIFLTV